MTRSDITRAVIAALITGILTGLGLAIVFG